MLNCEKTLVNVLFEIAPFYRYLNEKLETPLFVLNFSKWGIIYFNKCAFLKNIILAFFSSINIGNNICDSKYVYVSKFQMFVSLVRLVFIAICLLNHK